MKKTLAVFAFAALLTPLAWAQKSADVAALVEKAMPKVVEIRRDLHQNPELSNREERTSRVVAARLREMGLEVQTGVAKHGVVAILRGAKPGPCVLLRADMDALPVAEATGLPFASQNEGVMHACGHDAHTAILLGAAEVLAAMKKDIAGTVKFMFQPAEEGPPAGEEGGAPLMIKEGVLENPKVDAAFALHVFSDLDTGKLGYNFGGTMASVDKFKVVIRGKQVHAAYPWGGIDPIVTAANAILALQTIASRTTDAREPVVVTVGIIEGGQRWNIIPESVTLEGTVRAHDKEIRRQVRADFERILSGVTSAHGASYDLLYEDQAPVTWNDPALGRKALPALERAVGKDNVVEVKPTMGGEDFAFVAEKVPGFYIRLGVRSAAVPGSESPLHTPGFVLDEAALPVGVRAMVELALEGLKTAGKR